MKNLGKKGTSFSSQAFSTVSACGTLPMKYIKVTTFEILNQSRSL